MAMCHMNVNKHSEAMIVHRDSCQLLPKNKYLFNASKLYLYKPIQLSYCFSFCATTDSHGYMMSVQDCESDNDSEIFTSKDSEVLWKEGRLNIKSATPSVIRRGLCMVRDEGNIKQIICKRQLINHCL
jgi:hypothetical protein